MLLGVNMAELKCRYWLFVFYPESAPDDWVSVIEDWQVPVIVSPLHDRDWATDEDTGELLLGVDGKPFYKKPHYHGILAFDNPLGYKKALGLVEDLGVHTCKVPRGTLSGAECYLCHLRNKNKTKYDIDQCTCINGYIPRFDELASSLSEFEVIIKAINDNDIVNYADLCQFIFDTAPEVYPVVIRYTTHWNNICRDRQRLRVTINRDNESYVKYLSYNSSRMPVGLSGS